MRSGSELPAALADAPDLVACAERCCEYLVERGYELSSLYMRRSGLLRRFASVGYWQVLDGFPEESGVIAATVRTGRSHLVDTTRSAEYLRAAPAIVAEACVPIHVGGEVAGALNIESNRPFQDGVIDLLEEVASCFSARATALGGLTEPTGWVLLADNAARLAHTQQKQDVIRTALEVATALSGAGSGLIALRNGDAFAVETAVGPLSAALEAVGSGSLDEIGEWVDSSLSCYTVGEPDGQGFTVEDSLRTAGVNTLIVVALAANDERLGYLLVADEVSALPGPELVEQLELLATLVAGALVRTQYLSELLTLSRRDPLTGLGHQRAFHDWLDEFRTGRFVGTALLSIDVDHFKAVNDFGGHQAGDRLLCALAASMADALRGDDELFRVGGDEFAAVLHGVDDATQALEIATRVRRGSLRAGAAVSIGIALTSDEERDGKELFRRADDALYRAKRVGRNVAVVWEPPVDAPSGSPLLRR